MDTEHPPLMRSRPLREQIYHRIRAMIVSGNLRPGEVINEPSIASSLGVSRTPVREAVKRLADEGLINVLAQSGTYVTAIDIRDIEEAYMIRSALEVESIRRAADRIAPHQLEALEDNIQLHEQAIARRRINEAIALDDAFHRMITEVNGYHMLWRAVDISKAQMDRGRYLAIPTEGNGERTISEHRAILRYLQRHDGEGAAAAMKSHLTNSLRVTVDAVTESQTPGAQP